MPFQPGDRVVHRSDRRPRSMVVAYVAVQTKAPKNIHDEMANIGRIVVPAYFCTWISGAKQGGGYFVEAELDPAP